MTLPIPTEDDEQAIVVQYCRLKGYKHFRVPNETYTKSFKQQMKNKRLGVVSGVPDLFIIINGRLIAIEMKRTKGSTTSQAQAEWIKTLNDVNVPAMVCKGADQAIDFINSFL
ncbi:hypothetical protein [Caudoviricetes sp.]|nr:hypothetical protein [Caudoviricetes sp.]